MEQVKLFGVDALNAGINQRAFARSVNVERNRNTSNNKLEKSLDKMLKELEISRSYIPDVNAGRVIALSRDEEGNVYCPENLRSNLYKGFLHNGLDIYNSE